MPAMCVGVGEDGEWDPPISVRIIVVTKVLPTWGSRTTWNVGVAPIRHGIRIIITTNLKEIAMVGVVAFTPMQSTRLNDLVLQSVP